MLYEIVESSISQDKNVCYFLYRHRAENENNVCDTYGFSASNLSATSSLDDVLTDFGTASALFSTITDKSVSVSGLQKFITEYVDKM